MTEPSGYLVDTNVAIALLAHEHASLDFAKQAAQEKLPLFFSVITECEVFTGLQSEELLSASRMFNTRRCIGVSSSVARLAAKLRREQKHKGRNLKTPDAIIIATALENQLALVSRDSDMNFVEMEHGILVIKP